MNSNNKQRVETQRRIRYDEGKRIFDEGGVEVFEKDKIWTVRDKGETVFVSKDKEDKGKFRCGCDDFLKNNECKHIRAVEMLIGAEELQNEDEEKLIVKSSENSKKEDEEISAKEIKKEMDKLELDEYINQNQNQNEKDEEAKGVGGKENVKEKEITDLTEEDLPTMAFEGDKIALDELVNKNFVIRDMLTRASAYSDGEYAILPIELDGKPYFTTTSSSVVMRQISELRDRLPFRCSVAKERSTRHKKWQYYTLIPVAK